MNFANRFAFTFCVLLVICLVIFMAVMILTTAPEVLVFLSILTILPLLIAGIFGASTEENKGPSKKASKKP